MSRRKNQGVTLMELLIVIAIVGLMAAIAYPSYRSSVIKSKRSDATAELMQTAQGLERCFTRFNVYNHANCQVATNLPYITPEGHYQVSGVLTATTFTLTAAPQAGQAADTKCANFGLDQTNAKTVTGSLPATDCW